MQHTAVAPQPDTPSPWRGAGALVAAGGVVMGLALGARHVQGLFLLPVTLERGWSREGFAFALAVQNLVWGLAQPFTGMVADRFGAGRVVAMGLLCHALGLAGMALSTTPAGFFWSAGSLVGLALSGTTFAVVYGALGRQVPPARRDAALAMAGALGGLGQFAMVPAAQALIEALGGTGAFGALGVLGIALALLLPLAAVLREPRAAAPGGSAASGLHTPGQPLRHALIEAFSHRGFWLLNAGFLACGFQLAFIATHLPAYLLQQHMRAADAVAALAIIALANVVGTWVCGRLGGLGGRFARKRLLAGVYLLRAAAIALFITLPPSRAGLWLFAAVMGFVWLGTVPLTTGIVAQVFGVRYLTTLFGFVFFGHQLGSFLGVWMGGWVVAATGSYLPVWWGAVALGLVAAALHWPIDDRAVPRLRAAAA